MFGLKSSDIDSILEVFGRYPDITEALVFGSRAMGNFKPGSDIDIALKGSLRSETVTNISAEFNERLPLPYKFDVIDYSEITVGPLREHVDKFGKILYTK